ncbi:uncharacterized protein LOC105421604 [Amborella trichopoda]|uniref:uncharacterized protein LOC105421604 n=1 Tax=Amborella trichopoda TaxID=13333 RepID=UPI0009BF89D7|nr:uncharacterized protein LOC105421604 [Amborella trichopoda]|eukprot:XP_020530554.1 uncharacterized protein LOC105421604 [Amborella trichopoda]
MAPLARFTLGSLWSWRPLMAAFEIRRCFRSRAALDALTMAIKEEAPNLILYNYPSFSGAFAALFAHLYHSRMGLPYLILPYSQVEPFRIEDFNMKGVTTCYLLDFVGPKGFAVKLSQVSHGVVIFDHHKSAKALLSPVEDCPENLSVHYDITKSSSLLAYDYFSELLNQNQLCNDQNGKLSLVISDDVWQLKMLLKYIEDADLQQWELSESNAFKIGLSSMRSKLNCITNPYIFDQLLEMSHTEFIAKGRSYIEHRQDAANKLLDGAFKIRLGKGFYGECLVMILLLY